jgi:hypothetical protein
MLLGGVGLVGPSLSWRLSGSIPSPIFVVATSFLALASVFHLEVEDEPFMGYIVKCPRDVEAKHGGYHLWVGSPVVTYIITALVS